MGFQDRMWPKHSEPSERSKRALSGSAVKGVNDLLQTTELFGLCHCWHCCEDTGFHPGHCNRREKSDIIWLKTQTNQSHGISSENQNPLKTSQRVPMLFFYELLKCECKMWLITSCTQWQICFLSLQVLGYYNRRGINPEAFLNEIKYIASDPDEKHFFNVTDESALKDIVDALGDRIFSLEGCARDSFYSAEKCKSSNSTWTPTNIKLKILGLLNENIYKKVLEQVADVLFSSMIQCRFKRAIFPLWFAFSPNVRVHVFRIFGKKTLFLYCGASDLSKTDLFTQEPVRMGQRLASRCLRLDFPHIMSRWVWLLLPRTICHYAGQHTLSQFLQRRNCSPQTVIHHFPANPRSPLPLRCLLCGPRGFRSSWFRSNWQGRGIGPFSTSAMQW